MTLNFHTLKHVGVCCLLRRNLAPPRLLSPSYSHSFFSKMNEAEFIKKGEGARVVACALPLEIFLLHAHEFRRDLLTDNSRLELAFKSPIRKYSGLIPSASHVFTNENTDSLLLSITQLCASE